MVLAGDELEPEPTPKAVAKVVEFTDPISSKQFRAEITSDSCYTGKWHWITGDYEP